jgi:hypothetical protein
VNRIDLRLVACLAASLVVAGCSDTSRDPFAVLAQAEVADAAFAEAEALGDLDAALKAIRLRVALLESAGLPEDLVGPVLAHGRGLLGEAEGSAATADTAASWSALRRLADYLPASEPRALAAALIHAAEARFADVVRHDEPVSRLQRERADRLLRGAREAVVEEDFPLAIRRAYYARQLLRSEP